MGEGIVCIYIIQNKINIMMYTYNTKRIEDTLYTSTLRFEFIYYLYMQHHFRKKLYTQNLTVFELQFHFHKS